jgi:hypothetical protein
MIFAAPLHRHLGPSDVTADFRHGGVLGAHSGSLCLSHGRTKERVKSSRFGVHVWVTHAISTLGLFGGFGRRVFFHITAILGLLFLVRFFFATRSLLSGAFVASFLVRLDVIDKLAVPVGVIAFS